MSEQLTECLKGIGLGSPVHVGAARTRNVPGSGYV